MVLNKYPLIDECVKEIVDKLSSSVAFHQKFAIIEDEIGLKKLVFMTTPIGVYNSKKEKFYIPERFEHYLPKLKQFGIDCEVTD